MILIIDNYDSFSYNLVQQVGRVNPDLKVIRNDALSVDEIEALHPSHIILSPGPGRPADAGVCEAFGAEVTYASELIHGKRSSIHIANGSPLFKGLPPIMDAARYHSLAVSRGSLPDELLIIAEDNADEVMGVKHRDFDVYGLQFHPESILTPQGNIIIENFLALGGKAQ